MFLYFKSKVDTKKFDKKVAVFGKELKLKRLLKIFLEKAATTHIFLKRLSINLRFLSCTKV